MQNHEHHGGIKDRKMKREWKENERKKKAGRIIGLANAATAIAAATTTTAITIATAAAIATAAPSFVRILQPSIQILRTSWFLALFFVSFYSVESIQPLKTPQRRTPPSLLLGVENLLPALKDFHFSYFRH